MNKTIIVEFNRRPSDLLSLFQAFRTRKSSLYSDGFIPEIHARRTGLQADPAHIKSFFTVCRIEPTPYLHIMYPFTIVYPYLMRILSRKEIPFSLFNVLNTKNHIRMYRAINPDEKLDIDCCYTSMRQVSKGIEFDFHADVYSDNVRVWENTATYYKRVNRITRMETEKSQRLESLHNSSFTTNWYIDGKNRFRFGRISGDTNGIHYSSFYARMFGFKRDFAQPIRVLAQCISNLNDEKKAYSPGDLEFFIKGPVYYQSMLTLINCETANSDRFDLFCEGNEKPCISGKLVSDI